MYIFLDHHLNVNVLNVGIKLAQYITVRCLSSSLTMVPRYWAIGCRFKPLF